MSMVRQFGGTAIDFHGANRIFNSRFLFFNVSHQIYIRI